MKDRDHKIRAMRASGATLREIGEHFGISFERVRQIVADMPLPEGRWTNKGGGRRRVESAQPKAGEVA